MHFNPEMLSLARESRGYTQTELARRSAYTQPTVSRFESGSLPLSDENVRVFARVLAYPERFFSQPDTIYGLGSSFLFHRKRQTMEVNALRRIQAEVNIARMRVERLLRGLDYEHPNEFVMYEVGQDGTPEQIAGMVRAVWRLPAGPLRNLTQVVESAGGIVLLYPFSVRKVDGLSLWVTPTPPLFFLNDRAPGDRNRWTLAHELGHMVMHRHVHQEIESEADCFASELLMPAADIRRELHGLTLAKAAALKMTWRVSIQALVRRARNLETIPPGRYKSLCVQISRAGMRTNEPNAIEPEQPQNLASILDVHRLEHGYDLDEISRLALASSAEFERLLSPARKKLRIAW